MRLTPALKRIILKAFDEYPNDDFDLATHIADLEDFTRDSINELDEIDRFICLEMMKRNMGCKHVMIDTSYQNEDITNVCDIISQSNYHTAFGITNYDNLATNEEKAILEYVKVCMTNKNIKMLDIHATIKTETIIKILKFNENIVDIRFYNYDEYQSERLLLNLMKCMENHKSLMYLSTATKPTDKLFKENERIFNKTGKFIDLDPTTYNITGPLVEEFKELRKIYKAGGHPDVKAAQ